MDIVKQPMDIVKQPMDIVKQPMDIVKQPIGKVKHPMDKIIHNKDIMLKVFEYIYGTICVQDIYSLIGLEEEKKIVVERIEFLHKEMLDMMVENNFNNMKIVNLHNTYFASLRYNFHRLIINNKLKKHTMDKHKKIM